MGAGSPGTAGAPRRRLARLLAAWAAAAGGCGEWDFVIDSDDHERPASKAARPASEAPWPDETATTTSASRGSRGAAYRAHMAAACAHVRAMDALTGRALALSFTAAVRQASENFDALRRRFGEADDDAWLHERWRDATTLSARTWAVGLDFAHQAMRAARAFHQTTGLVLGPLEAGEAARWGWAWAPAPGPTPRLTMGELDSALGAHIRELELAAVVLGHRLDIARVRVLQDLYLPTLVRLRTEVEQCLLANPFAWSQRAADHFAPARPPPPGAGVGAEPGAGAGNGGYAEADGGARARAPRPAPGAGPRTPRQRLLVHLEMAHLHPEPNDEAIRRAYRRRVLQVHPDKGGDSAAFRALQEAYQAWRDAEGGSPG